MKNITTIKEVSIGHALVCDAFEYGLENTIQKYLKIGQKEGAEMYQPSCSLPKKGFWCPPTLFTNVSQSHSVAKEEIFGPVLAIQTFRTIDDVITKAKADPKVFTYLKNSEIDKEIYIKEKILNIVIK